MRQKIIPIVDDKNTTDPFNTICDLKWNYPIFNMARGEFRSCCRTPSNRVSKEELDTLGIEAFSNNPRELAERLDLVKGVRTKACQSCWSLEDSGLGSPRHTAERFFHIMKYSKFKGDQTEYNEDFLRAYLNSVNDVNHNLLQSKNPYMLEISLGNTCDMKCMYCSHHYSSQWATELIKHGEITQAQYDTEFPKAPEGFDDLFWQWFDRYGRLNLKRLGIIGGEPLITPEFYTFAEKLISHMAPVNKFRKEKITFWIVTNFNTPKKYLDKFFNFFPKLNEYFNVEILISMESTGKRAEYIRNGLNWKRFTDNIHRLLEHRDLNFGFGFITSVSALSVIGMNDFVQWVYSLYDTYKRPILMKQNIVSFPSWQRPSILTAEYASHLFECIEFMKSKVDEMPVVEDLYGRWDQYILFLENLAETLQNNRIDVTSDRKKFVEWFTTYDQRRGLNLLKTFPELKKFHKFCEKLN